MTLTQILREIEDSNLQEAVFRALTERILKENQVLAKTNSEYWASLSVIRKINNGKNEAIDALTDFSNKE